MDVQISKNKGNEWSDDQVQKTQKREFKNLISLNESMRKTNVLLSYFMYAGDFTFLFLRTGINRKDGNPLGK